MSLVTIDMETFYTADYSLSKMTTESYIRDPRFQAIGVGIKFDNAPTDWIEGPQIAKTLSKINWSKHTILCHNTAFDGAILSWHYGIKPQLWLDTLSMARPKHGLTIGVSLKALAAHYGIGVKGTEVVQALGKRYEDFAAEDLARYGKYCINDVELTLDLFNILKEGFPRQELRVIDLLLRMYVEPVLMLDRKLLVDHLGAVQFKKEELLSKIVAGKDELMSAPKFAQVLTDLGVDPPTKLNAKGKKTYAFAKTDEGLKALLEHPDEKVQAVVAARLGVKSTLEETRTQAFIAIADRGLLPVPISYYAGHTGRGGGWDSINLQNLPRGGALRRSMVAPPDHTLVDGDSSQIEARIVAWLAGQGDLVEAFRDKKDLYCEFASRVYGRQILKANNPTERHVGKTCILGLGFGMGDTRFKDTLKAGVGGPSVEIDAYDAQRIVTLYRATYPMIPRLWRTAHKMIDAMYCGSDASLGPGDLIHADRDGVYLPNKMMLRYPGLEYDGKNYSYLNRRERVKLFGGKLVENIVQALARIVVFDQMVTIEGRLRSRIREVRGMGFTPGTYRAVGTVHDEIISCIPKVDTVWTVGMFEEEMIVAPAWASDLPVACEVKVADRYGDAK